MPKKRVSEHFYILYISRTCYNVSFSLILFISLIFNALCTLLFCNALIFSILYCFVCLFACLFAQKYQF